jgi:protein-tyrosine phosphatase
MIEAGCNLPGPCRGAVNDVFWIGETNNEMGVTLAIVLRPRGEDWLEDEMRRLQLNGVQTIVSMLEPWEAEALGLALEGSVAERNGLHFLSYPIPDRHTPSDIFSFRRFAAVLAERVHRGERIGVHCRGSIGRSTVMAASVLVHLGWEPRQALMAIALARGCPVPDTEEQREWILAYEASA